MMMYSIIVANRRVVTEADVVYSPKEANCNRAKIQQIAKR